jgi:hypothetical protein
VVAVGLTRGAEAGGSRPRATDREAPHLTARSDSQARSGHGVRRRDGPLLYQISQRSGLGRRLGESEFYEGVNQSDEW